MVRKRIELDEKTWVDVGEKKVVISQRQYNHTDHCWMTVEIELSKLEFKALTEIPIRCDRCGQEYPADVCHLDGGRVVCPACWGLPDTLGL